MATSAPFLRSAAITLGWLIVSVSTGGAQNPSLPTENIIVSAPGLAPDTALHDFVKSYTAASQVSGKTARWRAGICPVITGLPQKAGELVTDRVRQIAGMVDAPVAAQSCKPNIDIVFTLNPQVLLNGVRSKTPILLGYHDVAQEERLATVTHPLQAWYTTQTVDFHGSAYVDDRLCKNCGMYIPSASGVVFVPDARAFAVTGSRLGDGLSSELYHVIIVVDLAKVAGHTLGGLADYVAMLSLAQTQAFEVCEPVASITNLVSPGCDAGVKTSEITGSDLAYLHALYSIDPRGSFLQQQGDIAYQMKKGLEKR